MIAHYCRCDMMPWLLHRRPQQRGFTLMELVMVIVILGVLAVFAAPRMFNASDFNAQGFHDVHGPKGDIPATITAKSGVAYIGTPTNFNFDGLGQPVNGKRDMMETQIIQVSNAARAITVEAVTGFVHD